MTAVITEAFHVTSDDWAKHKTLSLVMVQRYWETGVPVLAAEPFDTETITPQVKVAATWLLVVLSHQLIRYEQSQR